MLHWRATVLPRSLFAKGARGGFALIFVLSLIALLMTFLIAAQSSVLVSRQLIQRSGERIQRAEEIGDVLAKGQRSLRAGQATTQETPLEIDESGAERYQATVRRLEPNDPIYSGVPGVEHRDGDALVTITWRDSTIVVLKHAAAETEAESDERRFSADREGRKRAERYLKGLEDADEFEVRLGPTTQTDQFLINGAQRRNGAIRTQ